MASDLCSPRRPSSSLFVLLTGLLVLTACSEAPKSSDSRVDRVNGTQAEEKLRALTSAALDPMALSLVGDEDATAGIDPSRLLLHLKFNGDLVDASGNGHDGTVVGSQAAYTTEACFGQALAIDPGYHVVLSNGSNLGPTASQPRTISFWLRANHSSGETGILASQYGNGSPSNSSFFIGFGQHGPADPGVRATGNGTDVLDAITPATDTWQHIAVVFADGANATRIYRNGILLETGTISINASTSTRSFVVGGLPGVSPSTFTGVLDNFRVYEGILTDTQVSTLANSCNFNAPVAVADSLTVIEGNTVATLDGGATSLLDNDVDADGDTLTAAVVTGPVNGTLNLNNDGTFAYTHDGSETTTDSFIYKVNDGAQDSNTAAISITVSPDNDAPTISDVADQTIAEDTDTGALAFTIGDAETATTDLVLNITSSNTAVVSNSGLTVGGSGANRTITVTPLADASGTTTITVNVIDGDGAFASDTFEVTVTAVNDAPTTTADTLTVGEGAGGAVDVVANDTDVDSTLSYAAVTITAQPSNGTVVVDVVDGELDYSHDGSETSADSFTYQICDNGSPVECATATVSVTVTPDNDGPSITNAGSAPATAAEDTAYSFTFAATDPESDALTWSVTAGTDTCGGTIAASGEYSFTETGPVPPASCVVAVGVCDTSNACDAATVTVTITPTNDAPVIAATIPTTATEDVAYSFTATGTDPEGDAMTWGLAASDDCPGAAIGASGTYTFDTSGPTPPASCTAAIELCDAGGACATATELVTITAVNDAPGFTTSAPTTATEDTLTSYDADATDPDSANLTFAVGAGDTCGGSVAASTGVYTFTPTGPTPPASCVVELTVCDDGGASQQCDTQTATVSITAVNDAPVAQADTLTVDEGASGTVDVLNNDTDGDSSLGYAGVTITVPPTNGTATVDAANGEIDYTHDGSETSSDALTYQICDGHPSDPQCATATVSITVTPQNDGPTVSDISDQSIGEDGSTGSIAFTIGDPDDAPATLTVTATSSNQTLAPDANLVLGGTDATRTLTITPAANESGTATITVTVSDGSLTATDTFVLTVAPVNDPPVAQGDSLTVPEEGSTALHVLANDSDIDSSLSYAGVTITSPPTHGNATVDTTSGQVVYGHDGSETTSDSFDYQICDTGTPVLCATATVTVTITPGNDAPIAQSDSLTVLEGATAPIDVLANDTDADSSLTYGSVTVTTQGSGGTATVTATGISYVHGGGEQATDAFSYRVCDGGSPERCDTATVTVTVTPVNDAPVITSTATTAATEDTLYSYNANATDADSANLTFAVTSGTDTCGGTISPTSGTYTFTPVGPTPPSDCVVGIEVCDDAATPACDSQVATVSITATNDAPVAQATTATTAEDTPVDITLTGTDPDGDALTFAVSNESNGTVTLGTPITTGDTTTVTATFAPAANYNGTAAGFQFTVGDGSVTSSAATVQVEVTAVNDTPVADATTATTNEDTAVTITLTGSDIEGQALTFAVDSPPSDGTLGAITPTGAASATVVYTPSGDYTGGDSFSFTVTDGGATSTPATVSITVDPVDDPAVAVDDSYVTDEDVTLTVDVATGLLDNDSDLEGDAFTVSTHTDPANGTLTVNPDGSFEYVPGGDFEGSDGFAYTITGGATASVTLTVTPVPDAPVANDDGTTTGEEQDVTIDVLANDSDVDAGDSFTVTATTDPANGTVVIGTGGLDVTYTPDVDYTGTDTFDYTITDGDGLTATATVTVVIDNVNDAPTVSDILDRSTNEDVPTGPIAFTVGDTETSASLLTVTATSSDQTVVADAGLVLGGSDSSRTLTVTPVANASGTTTLTINVSDGALQATDTFVFTVTPVNDPPVATDDTTPVDEDSTANVIDVLANDSDVDTGDTLTVTSVGTAGNGTAAVDGSGVVTYTPDSDFVGTDTFSYTVTDTGNATATATVTVTVTNLNDNPVAVDDTATTAEETAVSVDVLTNDSDVDAGATLAVTAVGTAGNGTVTFAAASVTYTPNMDFVGTDTLTYTVSDGQGGTATASVTVTVTNINDAPVAVDDTATTNEDTAVDIDVSSNDTDVDTTDTLSVDAVGTPTSGTTVINTSGGITYTPDADFNGTDTFDYTLTDGTVTVTATVTITVDAINDAPVAVDDTFSTDEDTTLTVGVASSVLDNDSDVDSGDTLTVTTHTNPGNGTLTIQPDGSFEYVPDADFNGTDSFTYTVEDSAGDSATASVDLTINAVNDAPVAADDSYDVDEDTTLTVDAATGVLANDTDVDTGDTLTAALDTDVVDGTLTLNSDGSFEYVPAANFTGLVTFTYVANDGTADSQIVTVTLDVGNTNDAPVLDPLGGPYMVTEGDTLTATFTATDADNDTLTFSSPDLPTGATLDANGNLSWTPTWQDAGSYTVTVEVSDGQETDTATIVITVSFLDADMDTLPDTWETSADLDPTTNDSDGDTIDDATEVGGDLDNPLDSDSDQILDALDLDSDEDGLSDADEAGDTDLATAPVDTDTDGTFDYLDPDSDDDGLDDGADNCPTVANDQQEDLDGDLLGDACDDDLDGDGLSNDDEDTLGTDPTLADTDGDTISDGDEVGDDVTMPLDTDGDQVIDALDDDADDDGVLDVDEAGDADLATAPVDTDADGTPDYLSTDADGDTIDDATDNCRLVENTDQLDTDMDGLGDACVDDADGDTVLDVDDNCPVVANADQADLDMDGQGDACDPDLDGDAVDNDVDNCVDVANDAQLDNDADGAGDACDDDDDDDGLSDALDNCPLIANADQVDSDMDGAGDACDPIELCADGADNDGDGEVDCDDTDCAGEGACQPVMDDADMGMDMGADTSIGDDVMEDADMILDGDTLDGGVVNDSDPGCCTTVRRKRGSDVPWPLAGGFALGLIGLVVARRRRR